MEARAGLPAGMAEVAGGGGISMAAMERRWSAKI